MRGSIQIIRGILGPGIGGGINPKEKGPTKALARCHNPLMYTRFLLPLAAAGGERPVRWESLQRGDPELKVENGVFAPPKKFEGRIDGPQIL